MPTALSRKTGIFHVYTLKSQPRGFYIHKLIEIDTCFQVVHPRHKWSLCEDVVLVSIFHFFLLLSMRLYKRLQHDIVHRVLLMCVQSLSCGEGRLKEVR